MTVESNIKQRKRINLKTHFSSRINFHFCFDYIFESSHLCSMDIFKLRSEPSRLLTQLALVSLA